MAAAAALAAHAQPGTAPAAATHSASEVAWRAGSRLGYAPTPATLQAIGASPAGWALQQVDAALAASRQPLPTVPDLARIHLPTADLAQGVLAEREARKVLRVQAVADGAAMATAPAPLAGSPLAFSRDMAQGAAVWRLMA